MLRRLKIMMFLLVAVCRLGFADDKLGFTEVRPPCKTLSPIIAKLTDLRGDALAAELKTLYAYGEKAGFPLIEPVPSYEEYVYLTFLYRAEGPADKEVNFEVFGVDSDYFFGKMQLHRLKNTDLYYQCYLIPNDICFSYRFAVKDTATGRVSREIDRYNPDTTPKAAKQGVASFSVLDLRKSEPDWNRKRYENTGSSIESLKFESGIMKNTRNVYVYLPAGYDPKRPGGYPVIYLFDSPIYLNRVEVPNILDSLIKEGRIEPIIAVLIDNPTKTSRNVELPLNSAFKDCIVKELVPFIRAKYDTSRDPERNVIGGMSYGGLAASFIAFHHPEVFGKVLSQSGSFWRGIQLADPAGDWIRGDWLVGEVLKADAKKLRLYLDWGLQEKLCMLSGRRMAKALGDKGYAFKVTEFDGWHDWSNSRKTFPFGLMFLLGGT